MEHPILVPDTFNLFTAQIAQRFRVAKMGIPVLDTTVKSGDSTFAPSWDIVMRHKGGALTDRGYTDVYKGMMRQSYRQATERWLAVIQQPSVCIMCYCAACTQEKYVFCHRLVLVSMYEKICQLNGRAFHYVGEITSGGIVQPILPGL
jgi:hypothetical protein